MLDPCGLSQLNTNWVPYVTRLLSRLKPWGPGWVSCVFSGGNPRRVPSVSRRQKPSGSGWITRTGPVLRPGWDPPGYLIGWLAGYFKS